jgi:tRNA threonylcarbamoyladenosine biosynthesis protein TsaB
MRMSGFGIRTSNFEFGNSDFESVGDPLGLGSSSCRKASCPPQNFTYVAIPDPPTSILHRRSSILYILSYVLLCATSHPTLHHDHMLTLALETSGPLGSVALVESGQVLCEKSLELGRQHGQSLLPAIRDVLTGCGKKAKDCDLIAVSVGPGSFTGVRVGVVCAKTLAYAARCRLAAVNALHAVACNSPASINRVNVIANAQRGALFTATYRRDASGSWVAEAEIEVVSAESWLAGLRSKDTVSGPGVEKIAALIADRCRLLDPEFRIPRAVWTARLGIRTFETGATSDFWAVEPLYLGRSSAEVQWDKLHPPR